MIDMLEESIDHCKVTGEKEVVSDYGVKGIVYLYNHWMDTDIGRMDGKGWFYCFPSPEDNRWFIIYLMEFGDIKRILMRMRIGRCWPLFDPKNSLVVGILHL